MSDDMDLISGCIVFVLVWAWRLLPWVLGFAALAWVLYMLARLTLATP